MGGSSKPKNPPLPAPVPKESNTTEAVDQVTRDRRRLQAGFLSSTVAGETGTTGTGGASFLG